MALLEKEKVIIDWYILTFDRTKPNPFPLETRHYLLDLRKVDPSIAEEIMAIVDKPSPVPKGISPSASDSVITISHGIHQPDFRILKYRHLFRRYYDAEEFRREFEEKAYDSVRSLSPELVGDYFETEEGRPISNQQMMEHVSGVTGLLIFDDVQSVLAIGPVPPRDISSWTAPTANTISHFLYVTEKLAASRWYKTEVSLTYLSSPNSDRQLLSYLSPERQETFEILSFIRQLYAGDELFNNALNLYMRHCSHSGKLAWVKKVKSDFNSLRDGEPGLSPVKGLGRQKLIDAFMYGARIMHAKPEASTEQLFKQLLATHGKAEVMSAITSSMKDLVGQAGLAYYPIKQDYGHWIGTAKLIGADRTQIDGLFSNVT